MIAIPYTYTNEPSFKPDNDSPLPHNIEAEEQILDGIFLDPNAIDRVKDRLKPEHFYIGAHKDIYQACLRLRKKGLPTDLLYVTSWLSDHDLLAKIGGRNKLASLVDRTVSAVNIDSFAGLVILTAYRRNLIKAGNEIVHLAYDTEAGWPEICIATESKVFSVIQTPFAPTKQENESWHYNQLVSELENIYLKEANPGLKLYRLNQLANAHPEIRGGVKGLEDLYMKSLCATVESRKTLDQLEEEVGTDGRKWLLGGILPQATTALIADGGVGKTKFLYDLLYCIAEGKNWNGFPATSDARRVLIYQGDESKHDMLQALNKRGFKPGTEVREKTGVRFGWNTDAMPTLYQDAAEFRPAVVMIDSLTFVNRYSLYDENRTEYSRPVLELNKFAAETGITVVIVHHTNRNGQARGTTAVRNAVSEVIKLEKDTKEGSNVQEKILTIEKSRSRRFPASYRLFFNEEDFSFSLLEEVGQELGSPDMSTKDQIVKFLQEHANIKFEAEEVAHQISTTSGNARRCLHQLARDGIVGLDEKTNSGTTKLYYISRDSGKRSTENPLPSVTITPSTRITSENDSSAYQSKLESLSGDMYKNNGSPHDHLGSPSCDHLREATQTNAQQHSLENIKQGDHLSMPEIAKKAESEIEEKLRQNDVLMITSLHDSQDDYSASAINVKLGDPSRRSQGDHQVITGDRDRLDDNSDVLHQPISIEPTEKPAQKINTISDKKDFDFWLISPTILGLHIASRLGDIICTAKPTAKILNKANNLVGYECSMTWAWPTGGKTTIKVGLTQAGDFEEGAHKIAKEWLEKQEPWKPQVNKDAMYCGELVKIVGRWERKWQVELAPSRFQYARTNQLSSPWSKT